MKRYITLLFILLSLSLGANSRDHSANIEIVDYAISIEQADLNIAITIATNNLRLKPNETLTITPVIVGGNSEVALPEIILAGRNGAIVSDRRGNIVDQTIVRCRRNHNEIIEYETDVPYQNFYNNAALKLATITLKCSRCSCVANDIDVAYDLLPSYNFTPYLSYIEMKEPQIKSDSVESIIYFDEGVKIIDPMYRQNSSEIAKISSLLQKERIAKVSISGSASPLGDYIYNITLSKERAEVLKRYLNSNCSSPIDKEQIWWQGENWEKLKIEIERSGMYDKIAAINILSGNSSIVERKKLLSQLNGGRTMRYIRENLYPQLRYAKCTLYFESDGHNIENLIEQYSKNRYSLSLDDLIMLSTHFKSDVVEYEKIVVFTANRYKKSVRAAVNLSSIMLSDGEIIESYNLLYPLRKNPLTWNNLAVTYVKMGDVDMAIEYLKGAAKRDDVQSAKNIDQLTTYIK